MSSFFLHRQEVPSDGLEIDTLMVFFSGHVFDEVAFDAAVQTEIDRNLSPDLMVIVARETQIDPIESAFKSTKIRSLTQRFSQNTTVYASAFDETGTETKVIALLGEKPTHVDLALLKTPALSGIFRRRQGLVEAGSSYHFRNPSGRHTDRFMRIANVMADPAEISFYAYCALPILKPDTRKIYVDTPALFPLASAINDHFVELNVDRRVEHDSFGSYEGISSYKFEQTAASIFLISASSSGSLSKLILSKIGTIDSSHIINVIYLGENPPTGATICNLQRRKTNPLGFDFRPQDNEDGDCKMCASGSVAIHLRGDRFELTGPPPHPVMVAHPDAPPGLQDQMGRFVGLQALTVGVAERGDTYNRHFHIAFDRVSGSPQFMDKLKNHVASSFPIAARCIVSIDSNSDDFARTILSLSGRNESELPIYGRGDLTDLLDKSSGSHIVIAASVIESGRSLLEVSRDLRVAYPKAPQTYYVGVAKFRSPDRFRNLKSTLTKTAGVSPHAFIPIEQILLPASTGDDAWARERALLRRVEQLTFDSKLRLNAGETAALKKRQTRLESASRPMCDSIFLPSDSEIELTLNPGFIYWPRESSDSTQKSQADLFYTISSVLQNLRGEKDYKKKSLRNDLFLHNILDPKIFGRFNDGAIQASFLRSAMPHELDYTDAIEESEEAARIVGRVLAGSNGASGTAALEFLLALACGTLKLRSTDLTECLAKAKLHSALGRALLAVTKARLGA